jgi:hypothetical protein
MVPNPNTSTYANNFVHRCHHRSSSYDGLDTTTIMSYSNTNSHGRNMRLRDMLDAKLSGFDPLGVRKSSSVDNESVGDRFLRCSIQSERL